jgi:CSLREA domain-containing protein
MPPTSRRVRVAFRLLASLVIPLALFGPSATAVRADAAFVVDSTADTFLMGSSDGICDDGTGHCTLREALIEAYYASGQKTITFSSSILPATIDLVNGALSLPGDDTLIDGPGTDSLTINGDGLGPGYRVVEITGNNNTIRHLTIDGARSTGIIIYEESSAGGASGNSIDDVVVTRSADAGVWLHAYYGVGGDGNSVTDSLIGVGDWSATACVEAERNGNSGIGLSGHIRNTHIEGNRVVCNGSMGIEVQSTAVSGTDFLNNQIGTDGTHALGNGYYGLLSQGSDTEISGNLVSGNGDIGVWVNAGDGAEVEGNKIGTDQSGTAAIPNGGNGVYVGSVAKNVVIGSATEPTARNIISGNGLDGIQLQVSPSSGNGPQVNGNIIGLNASGTAALPNGRYGVMATNQTLGVIIGADGATVDQLISGNGSSGIWVQYSQDVYIGSSNYIGVAADHSTPLGNSGDGVGIGWSTNSTVAPAVVAHNGGGVTVTGDSSSGILIRPGEVFGNGWTAVDLIGTAGFDANDLGDTDAGPNTLLNYPEITTASGHDITGTACLGCYVFIYEAIGDPTAVGGGGTYLMQVQADPGTGVWNATLPGGLTAWDVTLMASESPSPGNTSEMSPRYTAPHFQLFLPLVLRNAP